MKTIGGILLVALLAGCNSTGSKKWYAPATWFSDAPKKAVEKAEFEESEAKTDLLRAAQKTAHETERAIGLAPPSRPTEVAAESAQATTSALDQALGPLPVDELANLKSRVDALVSDNAALRADAEVARAKERESLATLSRRLVSAQDAAAKARAELGEAFVRENALANQLRTQRAMMWIAAGVGVLGVAGWVYVRFALGGIPQALGRGLSELRVRNPAAADQLTPILDSYLNRAEQDRIRRYAA